MNVLKQKEKNQPVQVFVRVRPLTREEDTFSVVDIKSAKELSIKYHSSCRSYFFDRIFGPETQQADVFKWVVEPVVSEVIAGYNCTVMAYGQTGTGKTYTMVGNRSSLNDDPQSGLIPRALSKLFDELRAQPLEYTVRVSYLVVYNEEIFDLLSPAEEQVKLKLYDDCLKKGSVIVQGLTECTVCTKTEVYTVLERGSKNRREASTLLNSNSTRAHTVFCVTVHTKEICVDGDDLLKTGKLYLVDLAGSENIKQSGATDMRAREACSINQSLLTLGRCITKLMERSSHIPYRESKLTRLLQDSLGGKTKTSLIATLSPSPQNSEETINTLDYASRAKCITNRPEMNQRLSKTALLHVYTLEIERLQKDLLATRTGRGVFLDCENYTTMLKEIDSQREEISEKISLIEMLEDQKSKVESTCATLKMLLANFENEVVAQDKKIFNLENDLSDAGKKITNLSEENEFKEHLVTSFCETEHQLHRIARNLLEVVDSSTSDNEMLHQKLESLIGLNSTNKKRVRERITEFNESLFRIKEAIGSFHEDSNQSNNTLLQQLVFLGEKQTEYQDLRSKYLTKIAETLTIYKETQRDNTLGKITNNLSVIQEEIHQEERSFQAMTNEKYEKIVSQNLLNLLDLLEKQENLNNEALSCLRSTAEENNLKTTNIITSMKKIFDGIQALISHSQEMNQELFSSLKNAVLLHKSDQKKINQNCETKLTYALNTLSNLQAFLGQHFASVDEKHERFLGEIHQASETISSQVANVGRMFQNAIETLEDCTTSIDLNKTSTLTQCKNLQNLQKDSSQETQKSLKTITNNLNDFLQDITKNISNFSSILHDKIHSNKISLHNLQERQNQQVVTLENTMIESSTDFQSSSDETFRQSNEIISEIYGRLENNKALCEDNKSYFCVELEKCGEGMKKLFTQDLEELQETGRTPRRKSYKYSRDIPETKPREEILDEFKKMRKIYLEEREDLKKNQSQEIFGDENLSRNLSA